MHDFLKHVLSIRFIWDVLSVTQSLHTLAFVLRSIYPQKRAMLHKQLHLHYAQILYGNYVLCAQLCWATRLMRQQHRGITPLLGYTPDMSKQKTPDEVVSKLVHSSCPKLSTTNLGENWSKSGRKSAGH